MLRAKFSAGVVLKPGEVAVTSLDDAFLKRVMDTVEKRMGDESFGVEEFAHEVALSRRHLDRKLAGLTNLSAAEFVRHMRLQRARELLEKNAATVAEIAFQVGFGSPSYFSHLLPRAIWLFTLRDTQAGLVARLLDRLRGYRPYPPRGCPNFNSDCLTSVISSPFDFFIFESISSNGGAT